MTLARILMQLVKSGDITVTHIKNTINIEVNNGDVFERDIVNPALLAEMFATLKPFLVKVNNGTIYNNIITSTYNYNGKTIVIFE